MQAIDKKTKTHQKRFANRVSATDCCGFFNLLTSVDGYQNPLKTAA